MPAPPPQPAPADFAARLASARARVRAAAARAGRDPESVRILAVAKTARPADLLEAWAAGQRLFAHNRVQALLADAELLPDAEWHAIGPVQGNKVSDCLRRAACVQTVGDARIAGRLDRAAELAGRRLPVLLQANLQPEDGRYGCPLAELAALARALAPLTRLEPRGLMTIAAAGAPPAALRAGFARLRAAAAELSAAGLLPAAPELSMGMTEDFEIAVEEGATLVRIGRLLFPPGAGA